MNSFPRCLAALALLACAPLTRATTVVQPTFERMVGSADYIVRVQVKSVASEWRESVSRPGQRYIASRIALEVQEVIAGAPPAPLVLDVVGGKVGDRELAIDGTPRLTAGQECILFVRGNGRSVYPLVGLSHGYFPVRRDPLTGESRVLRADGRLLYSVRDLAPSAGRTTAIRSASDRPLTADNFRNLIQQQQRELLTREKQK